MGNIFQALTITIIGGADGPTTIYVSKNAIPFFIAQAVLLLLMILTLVFFFRNLYKKNKRGMMFFGISTLVLLALILIPNILQ